MLILSRFYVCFVCFYFSFQTKETSSALSSEEIKQSSSGGDRITGKNEHNATAGEEEMSSEQTLEQSEDVRDEEDKRQSKEQLVEDSVGDSSDGTQEPAAENLNKCDDSPTSSETSPTVPADTPSNAEESPLDSENNASESFGETTSAVAKETNVPDCANS